MRDKQNGALTRAASLFTLPADAVAGLFHLELVGTRELYLENHKGVLEYTPTEVALHGGDRIIRITGRDLTLSAMTDAELRLTGWFDTISFQALSGVSF